MEQHSAISYRNEEHVAPEVNKSVPMHTLDPDLEKLRRIAMHRQNSMEGVALAADNHENRFTSAAQNFLKGMELTTLIALRAKQSKLEKA